MNAYEAGRRKVVPAVLIYPRYRGEFLMLHRNARGTADFHNGKWVGLGGKCEPDESPIETARRELAEESGLKPPAAAFRALGVLQCPNFKPSRSEDWIVFVFAVSASGADRRKRLVCPEGELHWVPRGALLKLDIWPGDRHFLPLVAADRPFLGTIWYRGGKDVRRWIRPL